MTKVWNNDRKRRHRAATSQAMKDYALHSQCPKCLRKSALKDIKGRCVSKSGTEYIGTVVVVCRWCDYERAGVEI